MICSGRRHERDRDRTLWGGRTVPQSLLLDGQQRMTSLYQVTLKGKMVETVTPKNKKVRQWFYIDVPRPP